MGYEIEREFMKFQHLSFINPEQNVRKILGSKTLENILTLQG
jgi:hypothetical protein